MESAQTPAPNVNPNAGNDSLNVSVWRQVVASVIGSLLGVSYGMAYGFTSPTDMEIINSRILTATQFYYFAAVLNLGLFVGGPCGSVLMEVFGRKTTLLLTTGPWILGWALIATGSGLTGLFTGRVLTGICCGISTVNSYVYSSEVSSRRVRGLLSFCFLLMITIGIFLSYTFGHLLSWRELAWLAGVVPVLQLFLAVFIPESPRWLLRKGKCAKAQQALQWLRGNDADVVAEYTEMREASKKTEVNFSLAHLFQPRYYKPGFLALVLVLSPQLAGHHVYSLYLSEVFMRAGLDGSSDLAAIGVSAFQIIAVIFSAFVVDKVGRRPLFIVTASMTFLSSFTMGLAYVLQEEAGIDQIWWLALMGVMVNMAAYYMGFGGASPIVMVEILPTKVRGVFSGIVTSATYVTTFGVTAGYPYLVWGLHDYGTFWLFSGVAFVSLIIIIFFLPETKGKSLEEIEQLFAECGYTDID